MEPFKIASFYFLNVFPEPLLYQMQAVLQDVLDISCKLKIDSWIEASGTEQWSWLQSYIFTTR